MFQKEAAHTLTEQFRCSEVYMHLFTFVLVHNSNPSRQLSFWVAVRLWDNTIAGTHTHKFTLNLQNSHQILTRYEPYSQRSGLMLLLQNQREDPILQCSDKVTHVEHVVPPWPC